MNSRFAAAILLAAALVASACSNSSDSAEPPDASGGASPTPTEPPKCPLTGEEPGDVAFLARPAVAVKVENSPQARPQSGLEDADVVIEEVVEGGITRFMAIYHCASSKQVGPVRSARLDDPHLLKPFGSNILVYSGGNTVVEGELQRRRVIKINEITASGPALYRVPPGTFTTHNLFASIPAVRRLDATRRARAPEAFFEFGDLTGRARRARKVTLKFLASSPVEYRFDRATELWERSEGGAPFMSESGGQIAVPNVLVLEVAVERGSLSDVAGNASPDIKLNGRGKLLLFRAGKVVKGRWRVAREGDNFELTTKGGEPIVLAPGQTWIELVPDERGEFKGSIEFK